MAGKKGRSGRPRKNKAKAKTPEMREPEKMGIADAMFPTMTTTKAEDLPVNVPVEVSSTESPNSSTSSFESTAAALDDKYGSALPGAGEPDGGTVSDIPPARPIIEVLPPATVKKYLEIIFDGAARAHGDHWRLSTIESESVAQATTDMLNEQAPKWLQESTNKFLIIWSVLMLGIVATRSQSLSKKLEAGIDKLLSFGKPSQPKETPQ